MKHNLQMRLGRHGKDTRVVIDGVDISERVFSVDIHSTASSITEIHIGYYNLDDQPITFRGQVDEVEDQADVSGFGEAPGSRLIPFTRPPA